MSVSGSEKRARPYSVSTRLTQDEKRAIKARANHHGLSVGSFLRMAALSKPMPRGKHMPKDQAYLLALALSSLGTLMNEVRKIEDDPAHKTRAEKIQREAIFLRDQCFIHLGRKP